ncbi:hypothetical protein GE21DRAFT_4238 [Neurospora crassa]|uniref:LPXTG-motif cell wall anchor domain-containing protein n=1 Tax=Neurospora crassa (strain ATCC 24698 / 74-OR23-1A / CBS 708.71 / DSM 1257 / FGSC 987) TaxID=367110 RepID=Q7SB60_NEUCR|nr:hypothetical protein NCU06253 [Neurospora crassa OR74A]EAA33621.2 hypothetical protein NCU06253 [Neurospora crassa OR74A]KHE87090.1 hypothetical protein GE21DRAFT_4238 [Neurospora crassa]|eukprot:XP_962857.2 hypothetical protein NCU06253 [Neurospora crassa OR74A]
MTSSSLGGQGLAPGAASTFHLTVDSFSFQPTTRHSPTAATGRTQLRRRGRGTGTWKKGTDSAGTRSPGGKKHNSGSAVITSNSNTNQLPGPGSNLDTHNNTGITTASSTTACLATSNGIAVQTADEINIHHTHRQNHNSSKLPAFRFADLKKDASLFPPSLPLLQPIHIPPSPNNKSRRVSVSSTAGNPAQLPFNLQLGAPASPPQFNQQKQPQPTSPFHHNFVKRPQLSAEEEERSAETPPRRAHKRLQDSAAIQASTFQPFSPTAQDSSIGSKRPASSVCDSHIAARGPYVSRYRPASIVTPIGKRRQTTSIRLLPSIDTAQGPREPAPPATIKLSKVNEKRRSRPPASSKPAIVPSASGRDSGGQASTFPTRSLRSSTSRDDLSSDSDSDPGRTVGDTNEGDMSNSTQRDRALRALEGKRDDDMSRMTPPDSATAASDNENTAEIFMNIAREDPAPRPAQTRTEDQSAISRINRNSSHRRPLSTAIPSYQTSSPPQIANRRLSDSRDTISSRSRLLSDPQAVREPNLRGNPRDRLITNIAQEDLGRSQSVRTSLRQAPPTPRQIAFQDAYEAGAGLTRRSSIADISSVGRNSQYRNSNLAVGGRIYNSSPLVPRAPEPQRPETSQNAETNQGAEGTDSSTSTADPSTVWDELDDLKSRIHRLERTGKKPPAGAGNSRSSEERPPTATTNATTMSASPKRGSGGTTVNHGETASNASSRETQPILLSALLKTKGLISAEVFNAIESAANDALALTSMIGAAGQPGPISSGASVVGGYGSGVTDRQLRRKADSICRSLTELCIALTDEANQSKPAQPAAPNRETEKVITPTTAAKFTGITGRRRSSIMVETALPQPSVTSPRAPTTMEQRRISLLAASALPSPRTSAVPATPVDFGTPGRKSSLLLARNRRVAVEEPEEQVNGRRSSLLLRSRRVGQEEQEEMPAEGRKTSLLLRSRKVFNEEDEDRYRTPSRAITEVNGLRGTPRELASQASSPPDNTPLGSSALPRRRMVPTSISSRLSTPTAPVIQPSASRRYLDRTAGGERETIVASSYAERLAEERAQRQLSLGHTAMLNRTGSISRRARDSGIPSISTSNLQHQHQQQQQASAQQVGGYR